MPMMNNNTVIHLLRHGETAFNIKKVFRGRTEVPLNENGRTQGEKAARYLETKAIDRIFTSPLSRAMDTAETVGKAVGVEPETDERFTGMNFGKWQGRPHSEIRKEYPGLYQVYEKAIHRLKVPGGETLDQVRDRVSAGISDIVGKHVGETVLVVTHRVIIKTALLSVLDLPSSGFWRFKLDTCGLTTLRDTEHGLVVSKFNQTHYLGERGGAGEDF